MKLTKEDKELIGEAKEIIVKSKSVKLIDTGDVGSALKTPKGNIFRGVCLGFFVELVLVENTKQLAL